MARSSPQDSKIIVYGTTWCPDCEQVKDFLDAHDIGYESINVEEDPAAMEFVLRAANGKASVPTLQLPDGTILVEPSLGDLAAKLGIPTAAGPQLYDLIIIGGGPAGLTAGIYAAREGMRTLIVEKALTGGQAAITEWIENYPGFPEGVGGLDLSQRMEEQARRYGVEVATPEEVREIDDAEHYKILRTESGGELRARAVLVATGSSYRRLGAPGEDHFIGRGISYCATCDGPFFRDQEVLVIGGGNSAAEEGLFLTKFVKKATLIVRKGELRASQILKDNVLTHPKMGVEYWSEVREFRGDDRLRSVVLQNSQNGGQREVPVGGVFVFIGLDPNTQFLKGKVTLDEAGFVVTGPTLETSIPGVFAAGDVRAGSTKQVASAAGEGVTAALMIRHHLKPVLTAPLPYDVPAV